MTFLVDDVQFRIDFMEVVAVLSFSQDLIRLDPFSVVVVRQPLAEQQ